MTQSRVTFKRSSRRTKTLPVEMAPYSLRMMAFLLDLTLILAIAFFCLNAFILPETFPGVQETLQKQYLEYINACKLAIAQGQDWPLPKEDPALQEPMNFIAGFIFFSFWVYTILSELFLKGSSLGKRVFKLQVVGMYSFEPLGFFETFLRAAFKGLSLFAYGPWLWVDYLIPVFNKKRQSFHDIFSRSLVIVEPRLLAEKEMPSVNEDSFDDESGF